MAERKHDPGDDGPGIPRKKTAKERKQERESSRVYLLDSFPEWQKQKLIYEGRIKQYQESSSFSAVDLRSKRTHEEFAKHLLEIMHAHLCQFCSSTGSSSGIPMEVQVVEMAGQSGRQSEKYTQTESFFASYTTETAKAYTPTGHEAPPEPGYSSTPLEVHPRRNLEKLYSPSPIKAVTPIAAVDEDDGGLTSDEEDDLIHSMPIQVDDQPLEQPEVQNLETETAEDEVFRTTPDQKDDMDLDESIAIEGPTNLGDIEENKAIVPISKLTGLLKDLHGETCYREQCEEALIYEYSPVGTAVIFTWKCDAGHECGRWCTQERYSNMFSGNIQFPSAITLSGNNFAKIQLFFRVCRIFFVSMSTFTRVQRLYVCPSVEKMWNSMREVELEAAKEVEVNVAGDGRTDSPGHSAQFCTYTFMDMSTSKVLQVEVVDVREAGGKSPNMEKIGFERGLDKLREKVKVKEVVTDAHNQILALVKNGGKYEGVDHQIDVWHGAKNVVKRIAKVAQKSEFRDLQLWIPAVRNHFWYSARTCEGNTLKLKSIWFSILHHVADEHEWVLSIDGSIGKCSHEGLLESDRQKPWLKKGSKSHEALKAAITNKRFLNTLGYYRNFRHTGQLESFHNHMLMYATKRCAYSYEGYCTRMRLAAIDHNFHLDRKYASTVDGKPVHKGKFNKRSSRWTIERMKEPKTYGYIPDLMRLIFEMRRDTPGHLSQKALLSEADPRHIQPNIAKVPKPSMEMLLQEHKSRFGQGSSD